MVWPHLCWTGLLMCLCLLEHYSWNYLIIWLALWYTLFKKFGLQSWRVNILSGYLTLTSRDLCTRTVYGRSFLTKLTTFSWRLSTQASHQNKVTFRTKKQKCYKASNQWEKLAIYVFYLQSTVIALKPNLIFLYWKARRKEDEYFTLLLWNGM